MIPLFDPSKEKQGLEAAEKAMIFPVGAASPLWLMFAGAATAGMAFWWATRWRAATNLEAALPIPEPMTDPLLEVAPPAAAEPAPAEPEAVIEAVAEPVLKTPEPVIETAPGIQAAPEPVAPTPVVATPKPKARPASAPKAAAARRSPRTTSGPTRRA